MDKEKSNIHSILKSSNSTAGDKTKRLSFHKRLFEEATDNQEDVENTFETSLTSKPDEEFFPSYLKKTDFGFCYVPEEVKPSDSFVCTGTLKDHRFFPQNTRNEIVVMVLDEEFTAKDLVEEIEKVNNDSIKIKWIITSMPTLKQVKEADFFIFLLHLDVFQSLKMVKECLAIVQGHLGMLTLQVIILKIASELGPYGDVITPESVQDFLSRNRVNSYTYCKVNRERKRYILKNILNDIEEYKGITHSYDYFLAKSLLKCPILNGDEF